VDLGIVYIANEVEDMTCGIPSDDINDNEAVLVLQSLPCIWWYVQHISAYIYLTVQQ